MTRMKRIPALLAFVLLFISCGDKKPGTETNTGADSTVIDTLTVADSGKSNWCIAYETGNETDRTYALRLQALFSGMCGVTVPLRTSRDATEPAFRIGSDPRMALDTHDFAILPDGSGNILLYATGTEQFALLETVLGNMLESSGDGYLTLTVGDGYLYHRDRDNGLLASVEFLKNGLTDFVLVYSKRSEPSRDAAQSAADYIRKVSGVKLRVRSDDTENEKELLFGTPDRALTKAVNARLKDSGSWAISTDGRSVALCGADRLGWSRAVIAFAEKLRASGGDLTLYQADDRFSTEEPDAVLTATLYREMFGTFSSYTEWKQARLDEADIADVRLVEALRTRMGKSVALFIGSSTALREGWYIKTDPDDYSLVTERKNGHIMVAAALAGELFGETVGTPDRYADLTVLCGAASGWYLTEVAESNLVILTPSDEVPFEDPTRVSNGYTDAEYLARMELFFTDPERRDPGNATEQTRSVIAEAPYDPTVVWDYTKQAYLTNYSPGICTVQEGEQEILYVSYETCMVTDYKTERENTTHLCMSADGGKNWRTLGSVPGMRWACIFAHGGKIYLIGTHTETYHAMVAEYEPAGDAFRYRDLGYTGGIGGANPVLIAKGKIFKASGDRIMVADVGDDLLSPESWSFSRQAAMKLLTKEWFLRATGAPDFSDYALGEGSVLLDPDGNVTVIFRIDAGETCGYAAVVRVSDDGSTLSVIPECNSLVRMPTATSKFSVRYDSVSGRYLSLVSLPTMQKDAAKQRNVLALIASENLMDWQIVDTILVDREMMNNTMSAASHAYQYVDFDFSGSDVRFVVREASGVTNTYHDGTFITLYTIENFRTLLGGGESEGGN